MFVAFQGEKSDVSWSKAITSLTSPSNVFPAHREDADKHAYWQSLMKLIPVRMNILDIYES